MQMWVVQQILPPGMKDGEEADLRTEMLRVRCNGFQRFRRGAEENTVDHFLVLESDRGHFFRHGENDMKVRDVEKFGLAVFNPLSTSKGLTFWTMAITTRVERVPLMTTLIAALQVTAEGCGTAHLDRGHDAPLSRGHRRAMLFAIRFAIAAEHVRHFQLRPIHEPALRKAEAGRIEFP